MIDDLFAASSGLSDTALAVGEDVAAALDLAREAGQRLPMPGGGTTYRRWQLLAGLARANLTAARVVEPHVDALAILDEAEILTVADRDLTWGVFAAEAPDTRLDASRTGDGQVRLDGTKPWCSLAGLLDAALVTAHVGAERQLFRVNLRAPGVNVRAADGWVARGLRTVTSGAVDFDRVPAEAVGAPGWYLDRPGFAWGGAGVAACWYGGARALADALVQRAAKNDDPLLDLHVGTVDAALHAARVTLRDAAATIDAGSAAGPAGRLVAERVRAVVTWSAELTLAHVGRALGPAPLAFDLVHAARVADLELYLRQHHGERDLALLGALVARAGDAS
jgi:alkylation response protein AidB-like acyl-CoA dehydrogenase